MSIKEMQDALSRASGIAAQAQGYDPYKGINDGRPSTELENIQSCLLTARSQAVGIRSRLIELLVKLRGALPLEPGSSKTEIHPVPNGLIADLNDSLNFLGNNLSEATKLLDQIETAI